MSSESLKTFDTSPILKIPEDVTPEITEFLRKKAEEYAERMGTLIDGDIAPGPAHLDTLYKMTILQRLLDDGFVDLGAVAEELKKREGGVFDEKLFQNAYFVIEEYTKFGGNSNKVGHAG